MAAVPAPIRDSAFRRAAPAPAAAQATELFERHGARVLVYCERRLRSPEDAEDALQTTFLYACRGLRRGVEPENEIAWLLRIAHNVCLSHWDARRRRRVVEVPREPESLERAAAGARAGRDELLALRAALSGLTDLQQRAILLREWRGPSYREVADELGLSLAAVEALIFRARRALSEGLERQDIGRGRSRLARALDLGGLLAGVKSALGGGSAVKLAATATAVCVTALVPASAPPSSDRPASTPATSPAAAPADPAVAPGTRAAARLDLLAAEAERRRAAAPDERPRRTARGERKARKEASGAPPPLAPVGQVGQAVDDLVGAAAATTNAAVGLVQGAVGTVVETVETSPVGQTPVVEDVTGVVLPIVKSTAGPLLGGG